jgi:hypothetical protein
VIRTTTAALFIYPDGREVCRPNTAGKAEYRLRRSLAWNLQKGLCGICHLPVSLEAAVTDHKEPRGMGGARRDDRQANIRATHHMCNMEKGSRR